MTRNCHVRFGERSRETRLSQGRKVRSAPTLFSPVLSNLFLHYVFDVWMTRNYSGMPWCRYADDGLVHCNTEQEAQQILAALTQRFTACNLELHPAKTKIIYCKDSNRKGSYPQKAFDFLGYTFRPRFVKSKENRMFVSFSPAASKTAMKSMRAKIREQGFQRKTELELSDIAKIVNPVLRGWMEYYGRYQPSVLHSVFRHFNRKLVRWTMRKYKRFRGQKTNAAIYLQEIAKKQPQLFAHWKSGTGKAFA